MSIVLFDDVIEVPVDAETGNKFVAWNARDLPQMVNRSYRDSNNNCRLQYYTRGSTALRDAVGVSIQGAEEWLKNNEWFTGNIVVTVVTDGYENSSKVWQPAQLRNLIADKEKQGWIFVFQGANDSWLQASDFCVQAKYTQTFAATHAGVEAAYTSNSAAIGSLRSLGTYDTSLTNVASSTSK